MIKKQKCLRCNKILFDEKASATAGVYIICSFCAHLMRLNDQMKLIEVDMNCEIPKEVLNAQWMIKFSLWSGIDINKIISGLSK